MSFRADLVTGVGTMMTAFIAANPTLLIRHFTSRPESLVTELPCSYLDLRPESYHYDASTRERIMSASIVFVQRLTSNAETTDRGDALVDAFTEFADGYPHIITGSWWSDASWTDESVDISTDVPTFAMRWSPEVHLLEGRT